MLVVAWILETAEGQTCEGCLEHPPRAIVLLEDGLTIVELCDDCIPDGISDPIANVLSKALAPDPPSTTTES